MKVAGSGFKGEGAAAGAGRRSVFNNVAGAVIGEYLKSPVSKVAGKGYISDVAVAVACSGTCDSGYGPVYVAFFIWDEFGQAWSSR